jgi:hypothetical protein
MSCKLALIAERCHAQNSLNTWSTLAFCGNFEQNWKSQKGDPLSNSPVVSLRLWTRVARFGHFSPVGGCPPWAGFKNDLSSQNHRVNFYNGKSCVLIFCKNGLGCILGDFFTISSGHPAVGKVSSRVYFLRIHTSKNWKLFQKNLIRVSLWNFRPTHFLFKLMHYFWRKYFLNFPK